MLFDRCLEQVLTGHIQEQSLVKQQRNKIMPGSNLNNQTLWQITEVHRLHLHFESPNNKYLLLGRRISEEVVSV